MADSKHNATQASMGNEGLLAGGAIRLFGRPFTGLEVGDIALPATVNHQLATALRSAEAEGRKPSLARIYGFSHLATYHKLPEPLVFLVFAAGLPVPSGSLDPDASSEIGGVNPKGRVFAEDVQMWTCDQLDMALRIDIRIGWFKDLLLDEVARDDDSDGDVARRAEIVGRDANLVGRAANLIGRGR